MNGILNIYKEAGYTSFDVVAKLRRILGFKKIGHTGTLDPAAVGVLPVCIGKATKLCELITDGTKTYEAVMLLGVSTDTLDMQGEIIKTHPVECTEDDVRKCIMSFIGEKEQIPPMYSAIRVGGKRLYELARQGISVERKPRKVCFHEIKILDIDMPRIRFSVTCSKGTYIRSLCADIGDKLGCGGCMESLIRTHSGRFDIDSAHTLSEIEEFVRNNELDKVLIHMDEVFDEYPRVESMRQHDKTVHNGGKISLDCCNCANVDLHDNMRVRMYDSDGIFIGIYGYDTTDGILSPVKMLCE